MARSCLPREWRQARPTHHSGDYFSFTQFSLANTCGPPMCRFQSAVMFRLSSCWGSLCLNSYFDIWEIFALQKFFLLAHLKRKKNSKLGIRAHIPKRTQTAGSEEGLRPVDSKCSQVAGPPAGLLHCGRMPDCSPEAPAFGALGADRGKTA